MTDQDLIAWLRDLAEALGKEAFTRAADRIETLGRACTEWAEVPQSNYQRAKETQAKLTKAMEALRFYAPQTVGGITFVGGDDAGKRAAATLAELEGEKK